MWIHMEISLAWHRFTNLWLLSAIKLQLCMHELVNFCLHMVQTWSQWIVLKVIIVVATTALLWIVTVESWFTEITCPGDFTVNYHFMTLFTKVSREISTPEVDCHLDDFVQNIVFCHYSAMIVLYLHSL